MNKPKTLEEALQLVPEYILLRPEEKNIDGDEFFNNQSDTWCIIEPRDILSGYLPRRRPIPADVRERMANNLRGLYPAYDTTFADWPFESWLLQGGRND